ncbi:hypothetical protein C9I92_23575 [Photobacterium ganghwense]|uniref:Zinc resistance-associated protein n=1 Tax=Photobacterium ganghwense TaxID=320778 RepID=A0A0J1HJE7_9GAMM|nr:hypothetical protein [Photobacterium ganghwense]KLV11691.1 hypothetical protein ABT57_00070 [Photobacterium ganghwense]PSU04550.1 hypothetical protein C9I92_23575 [Photobacterium ganghwense]QSV14665.1 hypothetical protein FH974_03230 [Photobacterium ganghwense]
MNTIAKHLLVTLSLVLAWQAHATEQEAGPGVLTLDKAQWHAELDETMQAQKRSVLNSLTHEQSAQLKASALDSNSMMIADVEQLHLQQQLSQPDAHSETKAILVSTRKLMPEQTP